MTHPPSSFLGGTPYEVPQQPAPHSGHGYRMPEHQHLAQHYGQGRTSAQLAQDLGRTPGAVRTHVSRHPELRPPKP